MGSIEARGPSHCANMLKLVLLSLGLAAAQSPDMMREIMQQINKFNMRQACWGETNTINYAVSIIKAQEKCMQLAPTYDLVSVLTPQSNPFTTLPGQMLKYLEAMYGKDDSKKPSEFGLPDDKYDAAAVSIMVMQNAASSEEEFVGNFFWGEMGM